MHEGKALRKLVKGDDRKVEDIAAKIGISRGYMYKLYLLSEIGDYYKKKLKEIGISVDSNEDTKVDSNGEGIFKVNFRRQYPYKKASGELSMNDLILLSIEQLFSLQSEQEDVTMVKAIQQVIAYKQYAEGLERENKLLKEMIDILKTKK